MGSFAWLFFIALPLIDAVGSHWQTLRTAVTFVSAGVFVVGYVAVVLSWRRRGRGLSPARAGASWIPGSRRPHSARWRAH
jgi:hypothetical protein